MILQKKLSSKYRLFTVFVGPAIALAAYVIGFLVFTKDPNREALLGFTKLFVLSFILICAWDFIFIYMLHGYKKLDLDKITFISHSVHQLRTPLTAMRWHIEMMLGGETGVLSQEQENFVKKLSHETESLALLLNKLLVVDHILTERQTVSAAPVDITKAVSGAVEECRPLCEKLSKNMEIEYPQNDNEAVADTGMLHEVLVDLIKNALYYSADGSKISLSCKPSGKFMKISISNEGIGISESDKSKIGELFYRAEEAKKALPSGNGLDLFIARSFVSLMNGKLWFEGEEGKSATVNFTLPLKKS